MGLFPDVKLLQSSILVYGLLYCIQQKSLQDKSSLRQVIIILLIGWNVFQTWLSGRLCSLCLPVQGRWTCVQRQGLRGQAPYPSCSVTRGLKLISSRSHKNREKESERPLTGRGFFFFFPFSEVNRMSAPLTFHRGKQLFIRAQQRQRPTWEPSDITQLIWSSVPKLLSADRTSRLTENNFNDR